MKKSPKVYDLEFSTAKDSKASKIALLKQMTAAVGEIKLKFDKFLNPNDVKNTYKAMEYGDKQIAPADNEDGMMNKPKPLGKNGGSMTYAERNSSGQPTGDSMPNIKDDGYTATSNDDDSWEDFVEWVLPLQNEIQCLAEMMAGLSMRIDNQSNDFYNYVYNHQQGHLPKILGPAQMEEVLKVLGMNKDYIVQKNYVYASDGSPKEYNFKLTRKK